MICARRAVLDDLLCHLVKRRIVCTAHGSTCQEADAVRSASVHNWAELGTGCGDHDYTFYICWKSRQQCGAPRLRRLLETGNPFDFFLLFVVVEIIGRLVPILCTWYMF